MSEITFLFATGSSSSARPTSRTAAAIRSAGGRAAPPSRVGDRGGARRLRLRGLPGQLVGGHDLLERGLVGRREIDRLVGEAVRRGADPADRLGVVPGAVAEPGDHRQQRGGLRGVQRPGGATAGCRAAGRKAGEEASDRLVAHDREATGSPGRREPAFPRVRRRLELARDGVKRLSPPAGLVTRRRAPRRAPWYGRAAWPRRAGSCSRRIWTISPSRTRITPSALSWYGASVTVEWPWCVISATTTSGSSVSRITASTPSMTKAARRPDTCAK